MNDSQNNRLADLTPPKSPGRKPQFSIGKTLLWTAVVAGGLTVAKVSDTNSNFDPFPQAISLSFYLVVVCGILSFLRAPKSFDVWFPTGMNLFFTPIGNQVVEWVPRMEPLYDFQKFLEPFLKPLVLLSVIGVIPYGIFLLVLNVRRIKRRDFSISILVYHLGSWLGWTATWTICALGQFTYYFR